MKSTTDMIMDDVVLTCITTDKFKDGCLSLSLLTPLERESASLNALIPCVLRRGTATLPDMAAIAARLDSLYGAVLKPTVRKKGEIQTIGFTAVFADDKFIPEQSSNLENMAKLLGEVLLMPATRGGLLRRDYVESEKEKLLEKIRARINDKRSYSMKRLVEQMCVMENYAVDKLGSEQDAESITAQELTRHYKDLLASSPIEIFYCGSAEPALVKKTLKAALATLPRNGEEPDVGTEIRMNSLEAEPRYFEDELDISQGKLAIGFRLGECMEEPNVAAIKVMNAVFGGCVTSKLFMNVREKLSLAYFASSVVDLHKGLMLVSSGIEFDKYDAALSEIFAQLEAVKNGDITDEEFDAAKRAVAGAYRSVEDSVPSMEEFYLNQALIGPDCSAAELAAAVEEVTKDEIIKIAFGVECDAIYFLRGSKEGE